MHEPTVPHLDTALTGPLLALERHLLDRQTEIEGWLRDQWRTTPPPFYTSVDLRNAGFKLAPVDANLFPAGFNNLSPAFLPLCVQAFQTAAERCAPGARQILVIPESHTRNLYYLESLAALCDMLRCAGYAVRIGSLLTPAPGELTLPSGRTLRLEPLQRVGERLRIGDFDPCCVLLNNDFSDGVPPILQGVEQSILPPLALSWAHRLKSDHFTHYRAAAEQLARRIDIDPWSIDPLARSCGEIDFMSRDGEECLADNVEALLTGIRAKYRQYGVDRPPFVLIKADAGTYGMGVMTVRDSREIHQLNRKERTRMARSKGGRATTRVILQEGVYTLERVGDATAEPVVYLIDRAVVGGFYRVHTRRGPDESLNAPGMSFEPLAFSDPLMLPDRLNAPDARPNRFYAYGVIARLAALAAAREAAAVAKDE